MHLCLKIHCLPVVYSMYIAVLCYCLILLIINSYGYFSSNNCIIFNLGFLHFLNLSSEQNNLYNE